MALDWRCLTPRFQEEGAALRTGGRALKGNTSQSPEHSPKPRPRGLNPTSAQGALERSSLSPRACLLFYIWVFEPCSA